MRTIGVFRVPTSFVLISMNEIEVMDSRSKNTDQPSVYQQLLEQRTGVPWYKKGYSRYGSSTTTGLGELILSKNLYVAIAGNNLGTGRSASDVMVNVEPADPRRLSTTCFSRRVRPTSSCRGRGSATRQTPTA